MSPIGGRGSRSSTDDAMLQTLDVGLGIDSRSFGFTAGNGPTSTTGACASSCFHAAPSGVSEGPVAVGAYMLPGATPPPLGSRGGAPCTKA